MWLLMLKRSSVIMSILVIIVLVMRSLMRVNFFFEGLVGVVWGLGWLEKIIVVVFMRFGLEIRKRSGGLL